jgi:hypothetical protein
MQRASILVTPSFCSIGCAWPDSPLNEGGRVLTSFSWVESASGVGEPWSLCGFVMFNRILEVTRKYHVAMSLPVSYTTPSLTTGRQHLESF